MFQRLVFIAAACCAAPQVLAQDLDFNFNGQTVQLEYSDRIHGPGGLNSARIGASGLFTSKDDDIVGLGARVMGQAGTGSPGLEVGIGADLFGGTVDSNGFAALALEGAVRYSPPPVPRLALGLRLFYAPDIVTFANAKDFVQAEVRIAYEVLPQSYIYIGYRDLRVGITGPGHKTVDSNGHIGIKIHF